jgi:hypothetical protein
MKNTLSTLLLLLLTAASATAGNKRKDISDTAVIPPYYRYSLHKLHYVSLLAGYNFSKNDLAEIGVGYTSRRRYKSNTSGAVFYLADEISLRNTLVMGPKAGLWIGNALAAGAAFIYYTDFKGGSDMRIRPEVGFGEHNIKVTYGYNIPLGDKLPGVSDHVVSVIANWKLKKLSEKMVERDWDARGRRRYAESPADTTFSRHSTVVIGGISGWNYPFGDASIGWCFDETVTKRKNIVAGVFFAGAEVKLSSEALLGFKAGLYMYGRHKVGFCGGASLVYYTGSEHRSLVVRPEAGIHIGMSRIVYGYNHVLTDYSFNAVSQHNVSALLALRLGRGRNGFSVSKKSIDF